MADMVERVARAIWQAREARFPKFTQRREPDAFDRQSGAWALCVSEARVAIEAMRDTGPNFSDSHLPFSMIDAGMTLLETAADDLAGGNGQDVPDWDYGMEAVAVYRAMIDAALASEPKP